MVKRVGSAANPFLVGQDPKRRAQIEAQLFKDFAPQDVLEEIWLSDIAVLTATIEYYRELEAAATLTLAKRRGLEPLLHAELSDKHNLTLNDAAGTNSIRHTMGEFTTADLAKISAIADLIIKMRRERERVYLLFERKRRPALLRAVKMTQEQGLESYAIEAASD